MATFKPTSDLFTTSQLCHKSLRSIANPFHRFIHALNRYVLATKQSQDRDTS